MLKGYNGTVVRVNLSIRKIDYERIAESDARKYIGGVGLAVKMLWDETTRDTGLLSPASPDVSVRPRSSSCFCWRGII